MEDEFTLSLEGKTLGNLRVVDLKQELEKRGLSKAGSKKDLIKRLKQQLEFEKLAEGSKSTGDCDLKKELDARTEQNEFVQRYLAQQQKIFAEQKEMKRRVELEETQKKTDESCTPSHGDESSSTEEEESDDTESNISDVNSSKRIDAKDSAAEKSEVVKNIVQHTEDSDLPASEDVIENKAVIRKSSIEENKSSFNDSDTEIKDSKIVLVIKNKHCDSSVDTTANIEKTGLLEKETNIESEINQTNKPEKSEKELSECVKMKSDHSKLKFKKKFGADSEFQRSETEKAHVIEVESSKTVEKVETESNINVDQNLKTETKENEAENEKEKYDASHDLTIVAVNTEFSDKTVGLNPAILPSEDRNKHFDSEEKIGNVKMKEGLELKSESLELKLKKSSSISTKQSLEEVSETHETSVMKNVDSSPPGVHSLEADDKSNPHSTDSRGVDSPNRESSGSEEREMGEIIESETLPEIKYKPRKLNFPGRKLNRKSTDEQNSDEPKSKKSKWGRFASSQKSSQTINISTDSLKSWFPDFKLVNEPVQNNEIPMEDSPPIQDKKPSFPQIIEEDTVSTSKTENKEQNSLENKESIGPVSKIVFIKNLVRPFTLQQLKELLKQTGNLVEEAFWIDKIKSKCFATYETEEGAIKTRNLLNGTRWPTSNPKILIAEFSTEEELEMHKSGMDTAKVVPEVIPQVPETHDSNISRTAGDHRKRDKEGEKKRDREKHRTQAPVREWDKDKVLQESPEKESKEKDYDKKDKKDVKKKQNEDTPAKLLDDLFQKTKSIPCIYWLPLTENQVIEREEARRRRKEEREKKLAQREQEESEHRNKRPRRETEGRRSSTRSRSPTSRRR